MSCMLHIHLCSNTKMSNDLFLDYGSLIVCMTNINKHRIVHLTSNTEISKYSCIITWININNYFVLESTVISADDLVTVI